MSKNRKVIVFVVGGLVGILVLVVSGLLFFFDINSHKPRLEGAASDVLGMQVRVHGRLGLGLFPNLHLTLNDAHIQNRGMAFVSADEARLRIGLLPLLRGQLRIDDITLRRPRVSIERDHAGQFNFENADAKRGAVPALALAQVSLREGTLLYRDKKSATGFEAEDCSLTVRDLRLSAGMNSEVLKNLSFATTLVCGKVQAKDFVLSDLTLSGSVHGGVFDLKPVSMRVFGAKGSGSIHADFSEAVPRYRVQYQLPQFHIEQFLLTLSPQHVANGLMDFSANLTMQGDDTRAITQSATGDISLRGENLTLVGRDLDDGLSRYESSQNFNLVDVGAFFFAGPIGLVATKGYNFASIFTGSGGSTQIRTLVSEWKVEHGVAHARDVAMATTQNRLALNGRLDFVEQRFDDVTVAAIDAGGCAAVQQKIRGPFRKPVVESPSMLMSLAGPALRVIKRGRDLFPGGECKPFYAGSVAPPTAP